MTLSWASYGAFVAFALLICISPGPDFAIVTKNALAGGRLSGISTALGVGVGSAVQGTIAAFGLGAIIVASRPVFEVVRWAGVAYLCVLGVQALRAALRARGTDVVEQVPTTGRGALTRLLQGVLTNLTNPKVLVFYLSVLPQFLGPTATVVDALTLANTLPVIGTVWLLAIVLALHLVRRWVLRRRVRRALDGATGLAMLGLAGRLATDAH
ncbi:LysE family translocator [Actinomycetospora sp. Odt1-22]|uniref:LysE family translocator n=1 Tax=Actinomycetospora termitidis TaxID=3053470 RepID=A0ABT7M3Y9_9PSEU|nr:LysE family translocator [Actinomycetospora sp. Odt1-22]MDL5155395.1 LysE family translocator [Actinomycetospora sp. Odt1-22]